MDTTTSTIAGDVSPSEVSRLPLNGRNYLQLAMMVPGITSNDVVNSPLGTTDGGPLIAKDGNQNVFGANYPGAIWRQFMTQALAALKLDPNKYRFEAPKWPDESSSTGPGPTTTPSPGPSGPSPSPSCPPADCPKTSPSPSRSKPKPTVSPSLPSPKPTLPTIQPPGAAAGP